LFLNVYRQKSKDASLTPSQLQEDGGISKFMEQTCSIPTEKISLAANKLLR
jgi:hypothetical protein